MSIPMLLDWCTNNGIIIDPRIQVCCDEQRGVHVVSKDVSIPAGDTLVRIPKDAVLSVKSCSLSDRIPFELHGLGAQLGLTFALYSEILLNKHSSRWFGYLQSLPPVDLPLFWESYPQSRKDPALDAVGPASSDLLLWLRGTEVMKQLLKKDDANRVMSDTIDQYYHHTVLPILLQTDVRDRLLQEPDLIAFRNAYSLVSSRAFILDAYHGLAMTPVADAFNHTLENHVHIESEFYVCPECGSFRECEHDYDDDHHHYSRFTQWTEGAHDLYYEMVSNAEIQPHEEVFNTYGEGLSNARLLVQYGFILDPNDNDILNFDTNEILCLFPSADASSEVPLFQDVDLISYASSFNDSDLIFPSTDFPSESAFCIDSDGKISSQLWIFLLRLLCQNTGCSNLFRTDDLRRPITTQADLEHITQDGRSHITEEGDNELDSACAVMLVEVARAVVRLCEMRKAAIGHPNVISENLGAMLDDVPEDGKRFKLVLSVLMSEHSILDCCRFNWLDFVSNFESGFP